MSAHKTVSIVNLLLGMFNIAIGILAATSEGYISGFFVLFNSTSVLWNWFLYLCVIILVLGNFLSAWQLLHPSVQKKGQIYTYGIVWMAFAIIFDVTLLILGYFVSIIILYLFKIGCALLGGLIQCSK